MILFPKGHLAKFGNIFDSCHWGNAAGIELVTTVECYSATGWPHQGPAWPHTSTGQGWETLPQTQAGNGNTHGTQVHLASCSQYIQSLRFLGPHSVTLRRRPPLQLPAALRHLLHLCHSKLLGQQPVRTSRGWGPGWAASNLTLVPQVTPFGNFYQLSCEPG